jgi:hypothetical protein
MTSPPKNPLLDSQTLAYDFKMLCGTAADLKNVDPQQEWVRHNALIESFAVRCRALLCFFFAHDLGSGFKCRSNDVTARDFCASWSVPRDPLLFENAKWQADKHVAHLTTERQNVNLAGGPQSDWNIQALLPHFVSLMEAFLVQAAGKLDAEAEAVIRDTISTFKQLRAVALALAPIVPAATPSNASRAPSGYSITAKTAPPDVDPSGRHRW